MLRTVFRCRGRTVALGLLTAICCGCAAGDTEQLRLARQYFADNNSAAARGPAAQRYFFQRTQHPDFIGGACDPGEVTVDLDPALSTLRPAPGFRPDGIRSPRGTTWVIGVEVTVRRAGMVVGHQIGSQHLVYLDGRVYGFAPCPA